MQTSQNPANESKGAELLLDVVNTFVVTSKRIDITVEIHYDLSLPEVWDDNCRLWTASDDGATYDDLIPLTDNSKVTQDGNMIQIRFSRVITNKHYSCLIDQGDDATIVVFENVTVTNDMAV